MGAKQPFADLGDAELMAAYVEGHAQAFAVFAARHERTIRYAIGKWCDSPHDRDDIWHDTLLKAQRGAAQFRGHCAPGTWLHRIALNTTKDYLRRNSMHRAESLDDLTYQFADPMAGNPALRSALRTALNQLDPTFREAFLIVDLHGYSVHEAAEILGVSAGTVKSRRSRARASLRIALDDSATSFPPDFLPAASTKKP